MPGAGLEPARDYSQGILSPLRLPISPPGRGGHRNIQGRPVPFGPAPPASSNIVLHAYFIFVHLHCTMPTVNEIKIGAAVRRLREMRGLSLRAVAEHAGFSASFLSQVENEQASPSISSMERIAAALGVTLGEFFQTVEQTPARVVRADCRQTLYSGWSNARLESLAGVEFSRIQPILITLKPGGTSGKNPSPAPLEEFALVLSGSAVLTIQDAEQVLGEGDAVTIPRGALRRWQNVTRTATQVVLVSVQ